MSDRAAFACVALVFVFAALVSFGVHVGTSRRVAPPLPAFPTLPPRDLRVLLVGSEINGLGDRLRRWPVYRGLARDVTEIASAAEPRSAGAVARYRNAWAGWSAPSGASASSPWRLLLSGDSMRGTGAPATLAPAALPAKGGVTLVLRPREFFGRAPGGVDVVPVNGIPESALGTADLGAESIREAWEILCGPDCLLALLDRDGSNAAHARGWSSLPGDPDAAGWLLLDPAVFQGKESPDGLAALEIVERFLDLPLRESLARSIEGPVVFALLDPRDEEVPRLLAAFDLARPAEARDALDRVFALGYLAEAVEVSRYRGILIGVWRPRAGARAALAAAVDGNVLLMALRPEDLREAIDRRRRGGEGPRSAMGALAAVGRGSWKGWSRSPFVAAGWEEILSARRAATPPAGFEVVSVGRWDGERFRVRSEGTAPAIAAEPLVPAARAVVRALRLER